MSWERTLVNWKRQVKWTWKNLANAMTISRVPVCGLIIYLFYRRQYWWAIWLILAAVVYCVVSDCLDGFVAKRLKAASKFGKTLDRFADKIFEYVMFAFLIFDGAVDASSKILAWPLTVLEVGSMIILWVAAKKNTDTGAHGWGKWKARIMNTGFIACVSSIAAKEQYGIDSSAVIVPILTVLFSISTVLAAVSLINHVVDHRRQLSCS
jgi:phosphatidylglycerophosphate synthase